ncbi:MAG: hypothetical protein ABSB67_02305 [Bryobacteraceae bacterium]|jgi:hypothetical protein
MSEHLSSRGISEWASGTRPPEVENHLHECAECREELTRLHGALSDFRDSLRSWGAAEGAPPQPMWRTENAQGAHRLRWALAAMVLVLLAAIPVYLARDRPRPGGTSAEDAVLLEQIDANVSRTVPATMEPLTSLVSWSSTNPAAATAKSLTKR